eukprot:2054980-Amphidinium_carterae.1
MRGEWSRGPSRFRSGTILYLAKIGRPRLQTVFALLARHSQVKLPKPRAPKQLVDAGLGQHPHRDPCRT